MPASNLGTAGRLLPNAEPVGLPSSVVVAGTTAAGTPAANAAPGGIQFETKRITSAGDISASQSGEYLVGIGLEGGATPGWLSYTYDSVSAGILPVGASGMDATGAIGPLEEVIYPFNMKLAGTLALKSGNESFGGGLGAVNAYFSNMPNPTPGAITSWAQVRGVAVTHAESGTSGTAETYTMPGGLTLSPKGMVAMSSVASGTATGIPIAVIEFAAQDPFANPYDVPARLDRTGKPPRVWPVPTRGPATSYSLTHIARSLGGATTVAIAGVLYV